MFMAALSYLLLRRQLLHLSQVSARSNQTYHAVNWALPGMLLGFRTPDHILHMQQHADLQGRMHGRQFHMMPCL